jgi:NADP-dependent alcohol dehydrogenase
MIGHELTALYGIDHAQSLAVVYPALLRHGRQAKRAKLLQYAERVWDAREGDEDARIDAAITRTEEFFRSLGVPTTLKEYGIAPDAARIVRRRIEERGARFGEHQRIGPAEIEAILSMC